MSDRLKSLHVVAPTEDLPQHGLVLGQVGTVVEVLDDGAFEVEFADDAGRPYLMVAVRGRPLIRPRYPHTPPARSALLDPQAARVPESGVV